MAKVKSSGLRNYVGRLGGSVYYMLKGQNIAREKAAEVSNPRTASQMRQRMQWANIVAMYKVLASYIGKKAFQNKRATWSDYNAFMSANLGADPVYMTKEMVQNGHAILAPYKVTEGSLPNVSLRYDAENECFVTGIKCSNLVLSNEMSVGEVSDCIINENAQWSKGDQLGIIIAMNGRAYHPFIYAFEIILDPNDERPIHEVMGIEAHDFQKVDDYLAFSVESLYNPTQGLDLAAAVIQSRTIAGKTSVSNQALVLNSDALVTYNQARTEDAFNDARESYGMPTEVWLDATYQYGDEPVVTPGRIVSITGRYSIDESQTIANFTITPGGRNTLEASDASAQDTKTYATIVTNKTLPDGEDFCLCFIPNGQSLPTAVSHVITATGAETLTNAWFDRNSAAAIEGRAGYYYLVNSDIWEADKVVAMMNVTN